MMSKNRAKTKTTCRSRAVHPVRDSHKTTSRPGKSRGEELSRQWKAESACQGSIHWRSIGPPIHCQKSLRSTSHHFTSARIRSLPVDDSFTQTTEYEGVWRKLPDKSHGGQATVPTVGLERVVRPVLAKLHLPTGDGQKTKGEPRFAHDASATSIRRRKGTASNWAKGCKDSMLLVQAIHRLSPSETIILFHRIHNDTWALESSPKPLISLLMSIVSLGLSRSSH